MHIKLNVRNCITYFISRRRIVCMAEARPDYHTGALIQQEGSNRECDGYRLRE